MVWVLVFHLWPDTVRGGWLGVGLFFTLSGYLIAGLLDKEVTSTGRLRLGRFMARRVRRLLPAALVTIVGTLALTALLDDQPLRMIGVDAVTAVLNVFNWHAASDEAGYAEIFDAAPEPLAHFWSLAIEEQFYLLFPVAVALTRRPEWVTAVMAAVCLAAVALWWGSTDAYVATPVRATEIAAGAALALAQARYGPVRRLFQAPTNLPLRSQAAWTLALSAAVALTVVSVVGLRPDSSIVFRGGPQLMSLCWTVLVIAAVRDGRPARLMSWLPLRWLGLRSYAVYLFHWPVIELTDWHPLVAIAMTLGLAEVSFRALEMPVRRGTGRLAMPVLAVATTAVLAVAAVAAVTSVPARGIAERAEGAEQVPDWLAEQNSAAAPTTGDAALDAAPAGPETGLTVPIITVLGDSTALYVADGLRQWGDASSLIAVVDHSRIGCSPAAAAGSKWVRLRDSPGTAGHPSGFVEEGACRDDLIEEGSNIVLVVDHGAVLFDHQNADGEWASILDPDLAADVSDTYRRLVDRARRVATTVVFTTAPRLLPSPGEDTANQPQTSPERAAAYNALIRSLVEELNSVDGAAAAELIDIADVLDEHGYGGAYGRSDGMHIEYGRSEAFAAEVLGPALLDLLNLG